MFMSKLRSTKKNNRIWWIVVVVVLGFGLVGSYALMAGGGGVPTQAPTGQAQSPEAAQQKIDGYKTSIASIEARLKDVKDPKEIASLNTALGNYRYDIGQTYMFELNKEAEAIAEFKLATASYLEAVKYDEKNVNTRTDLATAAMYSNQLDVAEEQFKEAVKIDAKHLNAHFNYAIFLANAKKDYKESLVMLNKAKEIAKGDKANEERISQVIQAVQAEANKPATPAPTTSGQTYGQTNGQ